ELRRAAPELEEGLLDDVLRLFHAAQDPAGDGQRAGRLLVVEDTQRGDVPFGNASEQLSVASFFLSALERGKQGSGNRLAQRKRSIAYRSGRGTPKGRQS